MYVCWAKNQAIYRRMRNCIADRTGISLTRLQSFLEGLRHMTFEEYELVCSVLGVGTDKFIFPRKPESTVQTAGMTDGGQASDETEED